MKRKRTTVLLSGRHLDVCIWRTLPCPHWTNPLLRDCRRHLWTAPLPLSCLFTL